MSIIKYIFKSLKYTRKFGVRGFIFITKIFWSKKQIISSSLKNLKYPFFLRNNSTDYFTFAQVFFNEEYDLPFVNSPKIIVDCGANIGLATLYFKNRFPDAKIIAIEPDDNNYKMLLKNTASYQDITCIKAGIWNCSTNLEIVDLNWGEWAYLVKPVEHETATSIKAISIKDIMNTYKLETIDILKIDIEGSEKELFELGQDEWIPNVNSIVIETHDRFKAGTSKSVFNALSKYDFSLTIKGENMLFDILN